MSNPAIQRRLGYYTARTSAHAFMIAHALTTVFLGRRKGVDLFTLTNPKIKEEPAKGLGAIGEIIAAIYLQNRLNDDVAKEIRSASAEECVP